MKKIIVFGKTIKSAYEYLDGIVGEIQLKDVKIYKKHMLEYFVGLNDGTTYEVRPSSLASRGCKCNIAYVENTVDEEIVQHVIRPLLIGENPQLIRFEI